MKLNEQKKLVLTQREYNKFVKLVMLNCEDINCKQCPFNDGTCLLSKLFCIADQAKRRK